MLRLTIESIPLAYLFTLLTPASAWHQSITSDGSSELRVKVLDYGGDECHNRNGGPEGVMGIMNTRNSDQLKGMAFWDVAGCDRVDPERYSLFIHWYDLPAAIQLLDLGLPGLEHRWKSFRRIIPNSPSWINFKNSGKGKYIPGPDGITPIGGFFADLLEKIPPGSIRYRVMGTNEYITIKDAIYVPKTVSTGVSLIEDKLLSVTEMAEARETLRGQISNWFYATGGTPVHLLQTKDYIFHDRVSQAYVQAAQPLNIGKVKNPGVLVVKQMLGEYRYLQGNSQDKALVDAANDERERIEKLQLESQAIKYTKFLRKDQNEHYKKYLASLGFTGEPQGQPGQPMFFPPQSYGEIIGVDEPKPEVDTGTNPPINHPNSQINIEEQQNQTQAEKIEQPTLEETFAADLIQSVREAPLEGYQEQFGFPSDPSIENSFADIRPDPEDFFRRQFMTAPQVSQTYNDLDRDFIDVLDQQYLRQREALKSKSLNELDWEFGDVDPWAKFRIPNLGSQSFDLGLRNQYQGGVAASQNQIAPSIGEFEGEEELLNAIFAGNEQDIQENNVPRFEEEKF
ncbi:hypothetical protein TWF788_005383 [Orbilia oligospora]|uniref:Uncharacterized protein n=1 Tax=Orbilia oligospora TaxID=2813651 RepID=A0A7C8PY85_ORBOL|nr:hypothetical protein TWF788_005383 [Orbilia oligospora]